MRAFDRYVERIRRLPAIAADAALALGLMTFGLIELTLFTNPADDTPPFHFGHWSIPLFVAMSLPFVIRRKYPWLAHPLILAALVFGVLAHLDAVVGLSAFVLLYVLVFSVAERVPTWAAVLSVMAGMGLVLIASAQDPSFNLGSALAGDIVYWLPPLGLAAFAGWAQRHRRLLTAQLEARADEVTLERERVAARAVAGERIRIAHELRALVLRGVERMTAQARVARRDLGAGGAGAMEDIEEIESTGRRTLVEMRRLLLVLRRSEAQGTEPEKLDVPRGHSEPTTLRGDNVADRVPGALARTWSWLRRPWAVDVLLVLVLAGFMAAEFIIFGAGPVFAGWLPVVLSAVVIGVLLVRRRLPFSVLCVVSTAVLVWILVTGDSPNASELALLIATYTVAAYKDPRWAIAAVALALLAWSPLPAKYRCLCLIDIGTLAIFAAAAGAAMYAGRRLIDELKTQTELLIRTQEDRARLAVAEERTRVAREMHDVVAHGVTVMVVQAGGARMVAESDPRLAKEMLDDVERAGLDAVRELQSLVGDIDPGSIALEGEVSAEAPDVQALITRLRSTGQAINLTEEGDPVPLDQGLQISLYRIVQEALTNARKHAPGTRAIVAIRHLRRAIEVEVTNTPAPGAGPAGVPGAGQGLIGIAERASLFGGTVEAGPTLEGGFRVVAHLPLELVPA